MRRARITYEGAFHHVMNRGLGGKNIFSNNKKKDYFLEILREKSQKYKMKLLAHTIMDNHYHLVLQNISGKLSDFMRQLNGDYGRYYRKQEGGKGYVFQGRYESTLIQEGPYLIMVTIYVLVNSVRAGITESAYEYKWSSIGEYFTGKDSDIVDNVFIEELLQSKEEMQKLSQEWSVRYIPVKNTRFGKVLGNEAYIKEAIKRFDRRNKITKTKRMRIKDYVFETPDEVIENFEKTNKTKISNIDLYSLKGKRLRAKLLVLLKDKAGLKYSDIISYPLFKSLKYSSLGHIYQKTKRKMQYEK
jgi:putative transposase